MTPIYALSKALHTPFVPIVNHLNVAIAAALTGLVYWLGSRIWGRWHLATWVAVALLVVDNSFTTWAVLGLEVHFLALWMLLALVALRGSGRYRAVGAGFALLAAHLTRPDAALFCVCVIGSELVEAVLEWRRGDRRVAGSVFRSALTLAAVWLLPYAAYFAWHNAYYRWPFPNTYYLKLGGDIDGWARGLEYTVEFFKIRMWVPAVGVLAVLTIKDRTLRVLVVYLALHVFYVIYVGGDFMPGHRFFVPELPQFALLVGAATGVIWKVCTISRCVDGCPRTGSSPR
jgi:hypothetical protein